MSRRVGLEYGPCFRCSQSLRSAVAGPQIAAAQIRNGSQGDETNYVVHPAVLDNGIQLLGAASSRGLNALLQAIVPVKVDSMTFYRCDPYEEVEAYADVSFDGHDTVGTWFFREAVIWHPSHPLGQS